MSLMSETPKSRHVITVKITVRAENRYGAIKVVSDKLLSYLSIVEPKETKESIEGWVFTDGESGPSPWRDFAKNKPPSNRPFFAYDARIKNVAEFATAVRWHGDREVYVDSNEAEFPFTHWMAIPPV
jgi:hypothetical protein